MDSWIILKKKKTDACTGIMMAIVGHSNKWHVLYTLYNPLPPPIIIIAK